MIAFIGIGANLGDALGNVKDAIERLSGLPHSKLVSVSSNWRTAPVDSSGDDYVNAVACIDTELAPPDLLAALQAIELAHGRERPYRNAPRTLDIDILMYGDEQIDTPALQLPHPRMHERAFVLAPLLEIAPDIVIPGHGPARALMAGVADQQISRIE